MKPTSYPHSGALTAPGDLVRPRRGARPRPVAPLELALFPPAVDALCDLDPHWFPRSPRAAA